jgi:hypothetical protein
MDLFFRKRVQRKHSNLTRSQVALTRYILNHDRKRLSFVQFLEKPANRFLLFLQNCESFLSRRPLPFLFAAQDFFGIKNQTQKFRRLNDVYGQTTVSV